MRSSAIANLLPFDLYLNEPTQHRVVHRNGLRERLVYLSPQAECALRIIGGFERKQLFSCHEG
jgi:hypothetical protein